jgi:alpha-mannosidase
MPNEKALPARLFWWEAGDGSRVLAFRIPYEYCAWGKDLEDHVRRCAGELKSPNLRSMCFFGVGNHGGGPTRENLDSLRRMTADQAYPQLLLGTPDEFFEYAQADGLPIPTVHDDLQHHSVGCYSVHSGIKRWNRQAENLLVTAEKVSALAAWTTGQPYPPDFEQAWKAVLFNQFHDVLAGTSLPAAYEDARDLYGEARAIAARGLNTALQSLAWQVRSEQQEGRTPIVVFNPHAWPVRTNVEVELGRLQARDSLVDDAGCRVSFQLIKPQAAANGRSRIAFVASLPPLGYRTYHILPCQPEKIGWRTTASAWRSTLRLGRSAGCLIKRPRWRSSAARPPARLSATIPAIPGRTTSSLFMGRQPTFRWKACDW